MILSEINDRAQQCYLCDIRKHGHKVIFGCGPQDAELMLIGESPGYNEDIDGIPFTGKAGKLLDQMLIHGMGMRRDEVYMCNILKCRPPDNRDPTPLETKNCGGWLESQIKSIKPKVILALGKFASCYLLGVDPETNRMGYLRDLNTKKRSLVMTWHPAFLLRRPEYKEQSQQDMNLVLELLNRPIVLEKYK